MPSELLIQCPDGQMKTVPLTGERLSIGRSSASELCFPEDAGLSRQHFAFESEGESWSVRDLGSKNGTFVNNIPLKARLMLKPGDRITAGHLVIVFEPDAADPAKGVVVFEGGDSNSPTTSTVVTSLEGALSNQTMAIQGGGAKSSAPMQALIRAGQELSENRPLAELFPVILDLAIQAVNAQRRLLGGFADGFGVLEVKPQIGDDEQHQHAADDKGGRQPQMLRRPEEIDAVEESHEQRRIAERRQCAADIADQKNEKHHDVNIVCPRRIGAQQRPDQDHGRARGADDARDQRAEGKYRGVNKRRAANRAGNQNAAGNHIERKQDGDESQIVGEQRMHQGPDRGVDTTQGRQRHKRQRGPDEGELAVVMVPEPAKSERTKRDSEQNAGKRQRPRPG